MTKGLLTGRKVKVLDGNSTWLTTVNYYDDQGRPIQVYSKKYSLNNDVWDRMTICYDFTDKIITTERLHNNITILNRYVYDHAGRKKEVYQKINSGPEVELAEYNYNELGQLVKKYLHGNSSSHLQSIDYRYNIRGWLTSINNAGLQVGDNNEHDYNVFGEELNYNNGSTAGGFNGPAQWNGNISGVSWKSKGPSISTNNIDVNGYAFQYDKLNRLKLANYGSGAYGSSLAGNAERYNEAIDYDAMGNISTLVRKGIQGTIDNLTYHYKQNEMSNQLASITDASNDPTGFKKVNYSGDDYVYDANGNLIQDKNKGLDISYNTLNLPQNVSNSSQSIAYIYDATGKKLKKTFPGEPDHYYMDGIEYAGSEMLFAMTEEGRVRPKTGGFTYDYFLKDHLGNIRVVLSSETPSLNIYPAATMEDGNASVENTYYANLDATRDVKPSGFDSEWDNQNVARLTNSDPSRQTGPSITLKVNSGDKLNLSVKSFYQSNGADYSRNALGATALGQLASALLNPMLLTGSSLGVATDFINSSAFGNGSNFQNMVGSLPGSNYNNPADYTPKAYLVWMLFDNEFNLVKTGNSSGMQQVPTGSDQLNTMVQSDIAMDKSGFFYAYVVNESPMNVYFDDFQVSTTSGQVLEENNYYPFGMLNAQLSAPGITDAANNYKYNGKELQNELNLSWLDYGARFYDPVIGRWHRPDLMSENYNDQSPYDYVANNPVSFIDPDGNFKTRAEAREYRMLHDMQGDILRDMYGDYFISEQGEYAGGGVGITQNLTYGPIGPNNGMGLRGGPIPIGFSYYSKGKGDYRQGLVYNRGISSSITAISIHVGTIETGFVTAELMQKGVTIFSKGAKILGKASTALGVGSIGYDIITGNVKASTVANGLVMAAGAGVLFFVGSAAAPFIAAAGVIYGIVSVAGGDEFLNNHISVPESFNILKESK